VAKKKTTRATNSNKAPLTGEPSAEDLMRQPDLTAPASMRFTCQLCVKVTHSEYMAHEVMALVQQGQIELDPLPPRQVGALILNGFPYTVVGYYTFREQDVQYEEAPGQCAFHGRFYEIHQDKTAMFHEMVASSMEDFELARQKTRELRENMGTTRVRRRKRRRSAKKK
jgi:hypothetical protein